MYPQVVLLSGRFCRRSAAQPSRSARAATPNPSQRPPDRHRLARDGWVWLWACEWGHRWGLRLDRHRRSRLRHSNGVGLHLRHGHSVLRLRELVRLLRLLEASQALLPHARLQLQSQRLVRCQRPLRLLGVVLEDLLLLVQAAHLGGVSCGPAAHRA